MHSIWSTATPSSYGGPACLVKHDSPGRSGCRSNLDDDADADADDDDPLSNNAFVAAFGPGTRAFGAARAAVAKFTIKMAVARARRGGLHGLSGKKKQAGFGLVELRLDCSTYSFISSTPFPQARDLHILLDPSRA